MRSSALARGFIALGALLIASAPVSAGASNRGHDGGERRADRIFHRGDVVGAPKSVVALFVVRRGSWLSEAELASFQRVPARCHEAQTGATQRGRLTLDLPEFQLTKGGFRASGTSTIQNPAFWSSPAFGVGALPKTDWKISGRFTKRGKRGSGRLSATATVVANDFIAETTDPVWDCATGQLRWKTKNSRVRLGGVLD
jgi:hypothetical protein